MEYITVKDATTGDDFQLSYKDYGQGRPIVLIHGWPLSKDMWEYQIDDLVNAGFRVIKYDRRGFGKSGKPWNGYDYDSLTDDLHALIEKLDLQEAVLVGFSMGGGETVRYISRYGSERISKIVLVSSIGPYLAKSNDNTDGVDPGIFAYMIEQINDDRIKFLDDFGNKFFGVSLLKKPVSAPMLDYYRGLASVALPRAVKQCVLAYGNTDFREDMKKVTVPALVIHGDSDEIVPIEASSDRTVKIIPNTTYKKYEGAPHGLFYTHRKQFNQDLSQFCRTDVATEGTPTTAQRKVSM